MASVINGEVEDFGAVLGTTSEQREAKDQYKKFAYGDLLQTIWSGHLNGWTDKV